MRVGSFVVEAKFVREDPMRVARIMSDMCVVRCEFIYSCDQFHYEAICDDFDDIALHETIPQYVIYTDGDKRHEVRRVDKSPVSV